jgi:hypothetical protein
LGRKIALNPDPTVFGVVTRMPKRQRTRLHARTTVKLDTVMGVAREMGRLIRLSYNGHISVSELTGYVYALDKTRAALESAIAIEADIKANAPPPPPGDFHINIVSIPSNHFVSSEQLAKDYDWAKEMAAAKVELAQLPAPGENEIPIEPTAGGLGNESGHNASSEPDRFACMTIEQLKIMAGVDVDPK